VQGQFNLIDRLSSPPAPQKLACPNFFSPLPAKPKGTISLPSVCPSVCLSVGLSVIPLSVFQTFLCSGWRYWTEIWCMTTSQWVTDQVWVSLRLTNFWVNYSPWCSHLVFLTIFCPGWSEESEIFYMAFSWIVVDQVRVWYIWPFFDWIMALYKLRHLVFWLIK
jgi:hypothetical protein